jgi:hypothetical protein
MASMWSFWCGCYYVAVDIGVVSKPWLSAERNHEILLVFCIVYLFHIAIFHGVSVAMKWDVMISWSVLYLGTNIEVYAEG